MGQRIVELGHLANHTDISWFKIFHKQALLNEEVKLSIGMTLGNGKKIAGLLKRFTFRELRVG